MLIILAIGTVFLINTSAVNRIIIEGQLSAHNVNLMIHLMTIRLKKLNIIEQN